MSKQIFITGQLVKTTYILSRHTKLFYSQVDALIREFSAEHSISNSDVVNTCSKLRDLFNEAGEQAHKDTKKFILNLLDRSE